MNEAKVLLVTSKKDIIGNSLLRWGIKNKPKLYLNSEK